MYSQGGGSPVPSNDMVTNYYGLYLDSGSELKYWDWIWENHQSFVFGTYRRFPRYGGGTGGGGRFPTLSDYLKAAIAKYDSWWDKASTVGIPMYDYTATDASGNTQTFGTQRQAEDFISARLPVMITLPEIMIEDLHAVVQHTLDNLDYYTKSGITDFTNAGGNTMNWLATSPIASAVGATWQEKYQGADVFRAENAVGGNAFTLPPVGMFFPRDKVITPTWKAHEFGHMLQARAFGLAVYYSSIVPNNAFTAGFANIFGGKLHSLDPTELDANQRAYDYLGHPGWWNDAWKVHR